MSVNRVKSTRALRRRQRSSQAPVPATTFACGHCGRDVPLAALGSHHRNHCPHCLWSIHVDRTPGDRAACCGGAMQPIAIEVRRNGEWAIIHRCQQCGTVNVNRIAGDDDERQLLALALRPIQQMPFPV